jgi:hypothetical protein
MDLDHFFFYLFLMKLGRTLSVMIASTLLIALFPAASKASYGGTVDYSNDRIVPMFGNLNSPSPNWSGFLYSSRIVFTAAHSEIRFDSSGNRVDQNLKEVYVGLPNSKVSASLKRVRAVAKFIPTQYRFNNAGLGDFMIYVLEEDLADVKPVRLMTPEIEKELTDAKAFIKLHGFGEYYDRCSAGEQLPCSKKPDSNTLEPRSISLQIRPYEDFKTLVGYERPQLLGELLTWQPGRTSPCGGDSGGSLTTTYNGEMLYLSVAGNGMNGYACGATDRFDGVGGIGYASPIHKHLDILALAEEYVKNVRAKEAEEKAKSIPTPTPTPSASPSNSPSPTPQPSKSPARVSTITCVKGKTIWKITKVNPTCPKGYTKKK